MINLSLPDGTFHSDKALSFAADGLVTSHYFGGSHDQCFQQALSLTRSQVKHSLYHEWRLYLSLQLIQQSVYFSLINRKPFKYLECGVGEGHTLLLAWNYFNCQLASNLTYLSHHFFSGEFLLIDTFSGVDPDLIEPSDNSNYKTATYNGATLDVIVDRFSMIPNLTIIAEPVPKALFQVSPSMQSPSFLHIDMNHDVPERHALAYFRPRISSGLILLDDYSFNGHSRQRLAIDQFCTQHNYPLPLNLPTGQGLILIVP